MMIEELKKAWVKELREKRHGIAYWLIHAYCPRLCLFNDGSILFCPREFIQKVGEFKVVIILDSFQEELIQWIQSENIKNIDTTQRSFYFSPSDEFKVIYDAPHFILSFEIYVAGEKGNKHIYKCKHYKILSIESLSLDVKYEFNSNNKRMYSGRDGTIILAEGEIE